MLEQNQEQQEEKERAFLEGFPEEIEKDKNKVELVEKSSTAYWTTVAHNVKNYSESLARIIAAGSGHLVKGILWCGDVTVGRLKWGNEFMTKRMGTSIESKIRSSFAVGE